MQSLNILNDIMKSTNGHIIYEIYLIIKYCYAHVFIYKQIYKIQTYETIGGLKGSLTKIIFSYFKRVFFNKSQFEL